MIIYLDSSALVKRYVIEAGSQAVNTWINTARPASTGLLTRAEVAAAICRAQRQGWIDEQLRHKALAQFHTEWESFGRLPVNEATVRRAEELACRHNLRSYDAVHLACALVYQQNLGELISLATFDRELWRAGQAEGLLLLPTQSP